MNDELRASRAKKALKFGILINGIIENDGKISRPVIRQLAKFKRSFNATSNDPILGEMIRHHLLVLAEVELYIRAHNAGDEVGAKRHKSESERLWDEGDVITNRIIEEVDKNDES